MGVPADESTHANIRPLKGSPRGSISPDRSQLAHHSTGGLYMPEHEVAGMHSPFLPTIGGKAELLISGGGGINSLVPTDRLNAEEDIY